MYRPKVLKLLTHKLLLVTLLAAVIGYVVVLHSQHVAALDRKDKDLQSLRDELQQLHADALEAATKDEEPSPQSSTDIATDTLEFEQME